MKIDFLCRDLLCGSEQLLVIVTKFCHFVLLAQEDLDECHTVAWFLPRTENLVFEYGILE